jgi:putative ABC transport system substrate-binding protein
MRRRDFITLFGVAFACPIAARAQQPMPVIGLLSSASTAVQANFLRAFQRGLGEVGYIESQNVVIEYRGAEEQNDRLPALAAELVRRQVSVIVCGRQHSRRSHGEGGDVNYSHRVPSRV